HRASASPSTASDLLGLHSFPTRRSSDLGVLSFYNTCYISDTFDQSPKFMLDNTQYTEYTEDNIRSLDWKEHIRMRPGMYIGKLGDGSSADDGIYILLKEVIDNCIDEFVMGAGKTIDIAIKDNVVNVRDYGRGIPLGKVVDVVSKMNTGGKYDSRAFKKSVGLNGVGTK